MKAIVIAPGIRSAQIKSFVTDKKKSSVSVITNPLFQNGIQEGSHAPENVIHGDQLLHENDFEPINRQAKEIARNWFLSLELPKSLEYRGLNLGSLLSHPLTYYFVTLLKTLNIYENLFEKFQPDSLILLSDGSDWDACGKFISEKKNVTFEKTVLSNGEPALSKGGSKYLKNSIKHLLHRLNQTFAPKPATGGVIFSCSLKFAMPFLLQNKSDYYLREIFSLKAYQLSFRHSFSHLIVSQDADSKKQSEYQSLTKTIWRDLDLTIEKLQLFSSKGRDLWPVVRPHFHALIHDSFPKFMNWIDSFYTLTATLKPSAVIVDEDVAPFNKCLVQVCNYAGIPAYTLIHGAPVFDIGSIPLSAKKALVWGASSKNRLLEWGLKPNQILEVGAPQYSYVSRINHSAAKKEVYNDLKIKSGQKLVLLATQPFHTNEKSDFLGTPLTSELIADALACMGTMLDAVDQATFVIKFHPGEKNEWFTSEIIDRFPSDIHKRIRLTKSYDTMKLIAASDLVLTFGSTVYFEALLLNRPVMIFDDPKAKFFEFMSQHRLNIKDPVASGKWLSRFFTENSTESVIQKQTRELELHFHEGNQRAVELISELIYPKAPALQ